MASHWPFQSWGRLLSEHTTAVSVLDRLLHHANFVVTDGVSTACARPRPATSSFGVPVASGCARTFSVMIATGARHVIVRHQDLGALRLDHVHDHALFGLRGNRDRRSSA
jgi:hypothetical protein